MTGFEECSAGRDMEVTYSKLRFYVDAHPFARAAISVREVLLSNRVLEIKRS